MGHGTPSYGGRRLHLKPWVPNLLLGIGDAPLDDVPKDFHHFWFEVRDLQTQLDRKAADG
jgi:hypothetical protein